MKILTITMLLLFTASLSYGQTPCQNGFAGSYPCKDYDLMSRISLATMNAGAGNDSWGWTDPSNGKEYAIIGLNNGTAFIDISNPTNPVYLGKLPTATTNSSWRDVKVYKDHAFIVSEASGHGMQVFDLRRLRSVSNPPRNFTADTRYTEFGNAHNIVINEDTGYAYVVGAQRNNGPYRGGPLFINIQNPQNPINAGGFRSGGQRAYTHDAQVVTYNGPDATYNGREILIGSNEIEVVIADITNKSNPITLSTIRYPDVGYTHQGWFTEDMRYFILGDETDEQGVGFNTRTIVFDFADLDNPKQHMIYTGPTAAIDHNGYVKGDKFYLANYRAGIRVIDIANIGAKSMTEVGFFDTYTSSNGAAFNGVWNVYPYFNSGNIVISDIEGGFFLVKKSNSGPCTPTTPSSLAASSITANSASLSWNAVAGTTYDLRYRELGTTSWTTNAVTGTSSTITGLSPLTQYEAQVRSKCSGGGNSQYSSSTTFTTIAGGPNNCVSSFPFTESFESSLGQWSDDTGDDLNFTRNSGGTPSNGTGPSAAADGTTYIYVEASVNGTGYPNKRAILNSPCLDFSALATPNITFQYHMTGSAIETLTVEARTNNTGSWTSVFSRAGAQGSNWNTANVDLTAYAGQSNVQLRFNVVTGDGNQGWQSDIAIDAVSIQNNGTDPDVCTTLDFNALQINSFSNQDASGQFSITPSGASLTLTNNTWKSIPFNYNVTPNTVIEFDFRSASQGEIHAVGFENDNSLTSSRYFKVHGTQDYGVTNYDNYAGGVASYVIPVGAFYTGQMDRLVFINDNDGGSGNESIFSLVKIYEGSCGGARQQVAEIQKLTPIIGKTTEEGFPMRLFPNPVSESFLNVSMITKDVFDYEIQSITGQLVGKGTTSDNRVNISNLRAGVYFLQVFTDNQVTIKRFVKL